MKPVPTIMRVNFTMVSRGLRVAWSPNLGFVTAVEKEVADIAAEAARTFAGLGCHVEEVTRTDFEDTLSMHGILWLRRACRHAGALSAGMGVTHGPAAGGLDQDWS